MCTLNLGLLFGILGVPRGWGRARLDLAGEFTDVRGVAWRDLYHQTPLECEQRKVMGRLMGSEYRQIIIALKTIT